MIVWIVSEQIEDGALTGLFRVFSTEEMAMEYYNKQDKKDFEYCVNEYEVDEE